MNLGITTHAVNRFVERVKPAHEFHAAKLELRALLELVPAPLPDVPEWIADVEPDTEFFVELADGICAAVKNGDVTTILTRGGCKPGAREKKNKKKAQKRHARRLKNSASGRKKLGKLSRRSFDGAAWD